MVIKYLWIFIIWTPTNREWNQWPLDYESWTLLSAPSGQLLKQLNGIIIDTYPMPLSQCTRVRDTNTHLTIGSYQYIEFDRIRGSASTRNVEGLEFDSRPRHTHSKWYKSHPRLMFSMGRYLGDTLNRCPVYQCLTQIYSSNYQCKVYIDSKMSFDDMPLRKYG